MATYAAPTIAPALTPVSDAQSRAALNTECLNRLLAGLPFPDGIGPRPYVAPRESRAGIAWILDGPAGGRAQ